MDIETFANKLLKTASIYVFTMEKMINEKNKKLTFQALSYQKSKFSTVSQ